MIICAVGVFIDISVITAALIVLAIGKKAGYHEEALLLAMIGGGKAGIKFFIISDVRSTLNASDTAIVFGFGDMIFPAFPPPIIARSSASS